MNILVLGSGARESCIAWCLGRSHNVNRVYISPGNAQYQVSSVNIEIKHPFSKVVDFCIKKDIDLVVVGGEELLAQGIVDCLKMDGIDVFGPNQQASVIESSKEWAKLFMDRHSIPTAPWYSFVQIKNDNNKALREATEYINRVPYNVVVKASGLAKGKGVVVCDNKKEAIESAKRLLDEYGTIVIEKRLEGEEISVLAFTDGYTISPMPIARDYKRLLDGDKGVNTGGMGAYAPVFIDDCLKDKIMKEILKPTIRGLLKEGKRFIGVIYAGILIENSNPYVLEFNCRFGDPETQVLLPLLKTDLCLIMSSCIDGTLDDIDIKWNTENSCVGVVLAREDYPNSEGISIKNNPEIDISNIELTNDSLLFYGTTYKSNNKISIPMGRNFTLVSKDKTLESATKNVYKNIESFRGMGLRWRNDIASKRNLKFTYEDSGVYMNQSDDLVKRIAPLARKTQTKACDASLGGFGGFCDINKIGYKHPILVSGTDGVGTKLMLAQDAHSNFHYNMGIDLVAMSVNDVLTHGAKPLFFLDYYATSKLDVDVAEQVIRGVCGGCIESGCALIGGETAQMPDMYGENRYDLAGFCVGVVEKDDMLPKPIPDNSILVALESNGLHSNGFSLVRHIMKTSNSSQELTISKDESFSLDILLKPTKIYVESCLQILEEYRNDVYAMAHITGGGITENLPRVLGKNQKAVIHINDITLSPLYQRLQELSNMTDEEMLRTWNCGVGMILVVNIYKADKIIKRMNELGEKAFPIGIVENYEEEDAKVFYRSSFSHKE